MESFKRTVFSLKENVDTLETRLSRLEGIKPVHDCHYVSTKSECGISPLDMLDTFRFTYEKIQDQNPTSHYPVSPRRYIYKLLNPSDAMKASDDMKDVLRSTRYCTFTSNTEPSDFQSVDNCVLLMQEGSSYQTAGTKEINKQLHTLFDEKLFDVIPFDSFISNSDCKPNGIRKPNSYHTSKIEIVFKNSYKIPPHVRYYITPFDNKINTSRVIELTTKRCTIEICYGIYMKDNGCGSYVEAYDHMMPTDTELHWMVDGVIDETSNQHIDLLCMEDKDDLKCEDSSNPPNE